MRAWSLQPASVERIDQASAQHATFEGQTSIAGNRAPSTIQIIRHARLQMRDGISELQIRVDIHQRPFLAFIAETDRGDFRSAQPTGEEPVWQAVGPARRIDPGPTYPAARYRQSEFLMEFTQHARFGRLVTFPASARQVPQSVRVSRTVRAATCAC